MLPTFTTFTTRHPRAFVVLSLSIFVCGGVLWGTEMFLDKNVVADPLAGLSPEERDKAERLSVLAGLHSTEPDTMSFEEKIAVLGSLKSQEVISEASVVDATGQQ